MSDPAIRVARSPEDVPRPRPRGRARAAVRSLFRREHREVQAVDGVSFTIEPGEVVGFLGPERRRQDDDAQDAQRPALPDAAARPTVLGHVPSRREAAFLRRITMVMGNRNQLQWDLPALDSFELIRAIYRLEPDRVPRARATSSSSCSTSASWSPSRSATCRSASG